MALKPGRAEVKMLLIGGIVGLVIGGALTVLYFSLATFFAVNAKALNTIEKGAENGKENAVRRNRHHRQEEGWMS